MNTCIVVLGSNISPEKNIKIARQILSEQFHVLAQAQCLKTEPIGETAQPYFINDSLLIESDFGQDDLRSQFKAIEVSLGRSPSADQAVKPRVIDIDIVVWNDVVVDQDFYQRDFVRRLVFELLPDVRY